jgi:hypothetical protein
LYDYQVPNDNEKFRPWFEPIDAETKINRVSLLLENFLDSRREDEEGNASYSQWGSFRLSQGFDINEARRDEDPSREKRPFDPLVGILNLRPFSELDVQASARYDYYESEIPSANVSFFFTGNRSGGRTDHYRVDYDYVKRGNQYLNFDIDLNLVYGYSMGGGLRRNLVLKQNVSSQLWLDYQSQCWGLRASLEELDGIRRVFVTFRLLNLGEIAGGTSLGG